MTTLSIAYFPPISYFSLLRRGEIVIEGCENYQKQSWRNRCNILSANGILSLQVPVVHEGGTFKHPIREIKVDYTRDWVSMHKRAIDSAYRSSAFFEYYRDEVFALLDARPALLWDLDRSVTDFFLNVYRMPRPSETMTFVGNQADIHPKHEDVYYSLRPYWQVFNSRWGFVPNLSVMDLLFNEGPSSVDFL